MKEIESHLHSQAERAVKVGAVLTSLGTGITATDAVFGNPVWAVVSGVCTVALATNTVINIRSERNLRKQLEQK